MDDDPDVGAAVQRILAKGSEALGEGPRREDTRENRTDREPHEMQDDADMGEERAERVEPEAEAEEAQTEEQFFEIPGDTEDAEPVKIPLSEAAEAVKQFRQMQGDIASAVTKAETEAQAKQDEIVGAIQRELDDLRVASQAAAAMMQRYLPQPPDEAIRYSDPQLYYEQKLYFEDYQRALSATLQQATTAEQRKTGKRDEYSQTLIQREHDKLSRFIPEWKDEASRATKRDAILSTLGEKYGLTKADLEDTFDHRAWRMLNDLAESVKSTAKAPEVRKAVQEKAAKITNGKMPAREQGTGRFVSEDRKVLRESGSVDAAARLFMRSGLTRGL